MQVIRGVWDFIQSQILGMKWLNDLIGSGLTALGLDTSNRWIGSIQFFVYDVIKITLLLCFLIYIISYIQSYFPPERSKKILGGFSWYWSKLGSSSAWNGYPFLLLLVYTIIYRLHIRWFTDRSNFFIPHFISDG
jgi:hypothetical protein